SPRRYSLLKSARRSWTRYSCGDKRRLGAVDMMLPPGRIVASQASPGYPKGNLLRRKNQTLRRLDDPALLISPRCHRHVQLATAPAFVFAVPQHGRHGGGQVEAVARGDDEEAVAVVPKRLGDAAVFGAEDVQGVVGMHEGV